jgi:hypothetical protein
MRYLVMLFGVLVLIGGISAWANSHQPHEFSVAIGVIQLGGIVLAIGMVAEDIVQAIKRGSQHRSDQAPRGDTQEE